MAYPTGSGSEQLYNGTINALSNAATAMFFDGAVNSTVGTNSHTVPALHIVTLLNIIITEQGNAAEGIYLYANDGTSDIKILENVSLPAYETYVFSEKMVLRAGHKLTINTANAANVDVFYSYILQNWS